DLGDALAVGVESGGLEIEQPEHALREALDQQIGDLVELGSQIGELQDRVFHSSSPSPISVSRSMSSSPPSSASAGSSWDCAGRPWPRYPPCEPCPWGWPRPFERLRLRRSLGSHTSQWPHGRGSPSSK